MKERNIGFARNALVVSSVLLAAVAVRAADRSFVAADGGWNVDENWSPSGVPVAGDTATVPDGKVCRVGAGVTTAFVQTTVAAGGTLAVEGGALLTSDNSTVKKSLSVNGRLVLSAGTLSVHDLSISSTGKAEFPGGTVTVYNNMYNLAATTETTGLHIGADVTLAKGYWNFNAPGGVIEGLGRPLGEIRVPTGTKTVGTLLVTNSNLTVSSLGVAYHTSSRSDVTGRVDVVDSDVALAKLQISDSHVTGRNRREIRVGSDATLSLVGSVGWTGLAADESLLVQIGGAGAENAKLVLTNASGAAKSVTLGPNATLAVCEGGAVSASQIYVRDGAELAVDGGTLQLPITCAEGGLVAIDGGTVEGTVTCAPRGRVLMDGGTLRTATLFSDKTESDDEAYYRFDGGAQLYLQDVVVGGSTVSSHSATDATITPTTMEFRDCALKCFDTYCYMNLGSKATQNRARVVFDGCRMDPAGGTNYKWYLRTNPNATCEVLVRGSANVLYFQQFEGNAFRLEYAFDGSARHIAPVTLERTGHPEAVGPRGNLYLTVVGGAMLADTASFDLIVSSNAMDLAQVDFASTPWTRGDSPWTGALTADKKAYRVTLTPVMEAAPGSGSHALATAKATGAVSVPVGSTEKVETLEVVLGIDGMTSAKASALVAALTAAGYAATADATSVVVSFAASAVTPQATNYFAWDFAEAGAAVSSVRVRAKERAEKFYLHFL